MINDIRKTVGINMYYILYAVSFFASFHLWANNTIKKLDDRMVAVNSLVCVGLDPDFTKFPLALKGSQESQEAIAYRFLTQIIDITAPYCCSFKLQKAFYDQFNEGHLLLKMVIAYIHEHYSDIPVFVDCKIGDTDNTMKAYMQLLFDDLQADAVVINPYMGDDVFEPFIQDENKAAIVLVQTSNSDAKIVQELLLANGNKLWEEILSLAINRWNKNKNLIIVLSSNIKGHNYTAIRSCIPHDMPILLAGIGAQGGDSMVMKQLLNQEKRGVFVNSSRGILYPYDPADLAWKDAVLNAVVELRDTLNTIRFS